MPGRIFVDHVCEFSDENKQLREDNARLQTLVIKLTEEQIELRRQIKELNNA